MPGCETLVFEGFTEEKFRRFAAGAKARGIPVDSESGDSGPGDFRMTWQFDAPRQTLSIRCTDRPSQASCREVNGAIRKLVAESAGEEKAGKAEGTATEETARKSARGRREREKILIPEVLGRVTIRLRSAIRGRERWEVRSIYQRPRMAQQVQAALSALPGVIQAEANSVTGRVLVVFDPDQFQGTVETELQRILDRLAHGAAETEEVRPWVMDNPIVQLLKHAQPPKGLLARSATWSAATALLSFFPVWGLSALMSVTKAGSTGKSSKGRLWLLGLVTAATNAAEWYVRHRQRQLWKEFASHAEHEIRTKAFAHVECLDMAFFDRQNTGQLLAVLSADVTVVGQFLENGPSNAIQAAVSVAVSVLTMIFISPSLGLLAAAPAAAVLLSARYFQKRIAPLYAQFGQDSAEMHRLLGNALFGIATIKSFTAEHREAERIENASERRRASYGRAIAASSANASFMHGTVYTTASAMTVATGAVYVAQGSLSNKSFLTMAQLIPKFYASMSQIDDIYDNYLNAGVSAQRLLNLFEAQSTILDGNNRLPAGQIRGNVRFRNVSFGYGPEMEVLKDINLDIRPGNTVGIVGATGAGKTTLVKLLLRFYDVDSGEVTIDGVDIRSFPVEELRRAVGFVSQDVYLFDGTVYDNIAYGRPGASRDEVIAAARAADAHEFIERLPHGYDSMVGERGQRLSTGQRQRISIARAVIKNAPILVLDEATASVDNETEAAIHRSIERVAVGRSMVVIAHRLSTVRNSACIYVLDEGRVQEKGTHDELLALGGLYASLWNVQTGKRTPS
jgi:ATP-binding cassette, subfamily B, bacterial